MATKNTEVTEVKRGRGRPSQVPGMVAKAQAGKGKFVKIGEFSPVAAMSRALKLQAAGLNVRVVVQAQDPTQA